MSRSLSRFSRKAGSSQLTRASMAQPRGSIRDSTIFCAWPSRIAETALQDTRRKPGDWNNGHERETETAMIGL